MALLNHNAVLTTALFYKNFILNISRSTKPAPLFWDLFGITGQFRPFPASWCVLPHPLQNRVPRVQVLLPLPKSQVSLLRYLTFSLVCGRIWQRGAPAGPPTVRVVGAYSPVGCVQARPRRQPRQVRPTNSS